MPKEQGSRYREIYPYQRGIDAGRSGIVPALQLASAKQTEHYIEGINTGLRRGFLSEHSFDPDELNVIFQPLTPATIEQYIKGVSVMPPGIARLIPEETETLTDEQRTNKINAVNAYKLGFLVHMVAGSIVRPAWRDIPSDDVAFAAFKDGSSGESKKLPPDRKPISLRGDERVYELGLETMISLRGGRGIVYPIQVRHPLLLQTFKLALDGKPVTPDLWQEFSNLISRGDLNKPEIELYFGGAIRAQRIKSKPTREAQVRALYSPIQESALLIRQRPELRVS